MWGAPWGGSGCAVLSVQKSAPQTVGVRGKWWVKGNVVVTETFCFPLWFKSSW